ncbi:DgyrCDS1706 [Dimorphilus gyrociliatus]|uniref:DgyrCDS1706 n=1 Tax=Dimorphilus gyrociliatus TaxID=2664684 RepID=A0A7I8V8D1_9ANNE|nr:DgyrCDS1706 [Dimorphilus gyrociliatus]
MIPSNQLWTPDLVVSNFAGDKFNDYMITNAIVRYNGLVLWLFPALVKTYCTLNVKYFPFDTQKCDIVFISWTYHGFQLDLAYNSSFENTVYYVPENQEWTVDGITAKRTEKKYACCSEPYPDVTFSIHMRRGSLFYVVNLIAPCFLIFLISFLGFFLPVESGEKVNLEITILLALVVFLLMVGETMPPTPDSVPILGMFFCSTMLMVSIALVMAVVVTNVYSKKDSFKSPPAGVLKIAKKFYQDKLPESRSVSINMSAMRIGKHNCNGSHGDVLSITESDLESLTCCNCCNCRTLPSSGQHNLRQGGHHYHMDYDRIQIEWRVVTKFVDRLFFWLFFVLSCAVQAFLFSQMVPERPKPEAIRT